MKRTTEGWLYGGRRAQWLDRYYTFIAHRGMMASLKKIESWRVRRLVFVCKGNICRSPYAEARARAMGFVALSCGLQCEQGARANASAMRNSALRGVDLSNHRASRFDPTRIFSSDLLIAMEPAQATRLKESVIDIGAQVTLIGLWSDPPRPYLPDPFGLADCAFQSCYSLIDAGIERLSSTLPIQRTTSWKSAQLR